MNRDELARHLDQLLDVSRIRDYCPNGLQVEGRPEVARLVSGVTASVALIERAAAAGADALLVHHGYFWRGEDPRLVGPRKRRKTGSSGTAWREPRAVPEVKMYTTAGAALATASL